MSILIIIFILLLIFSAFFSSTETVYYLSEEKIKNQFVKVNRDLFLIFILLSNTIVNIFIGITSEKIFAHTIFKDKSIIYGIVTTTTILLFLGEIIPKRLALIVYPVIDKKFLYLMQKWIDSIRFFEKVLNFFIKPISKLNKEDKVFSIREIKEVLNDGINKGYFNSTQASLLSNLISQSMSYVKDNMIHYTELPLITNSMNINEIYDSFKKSELKKIPVVSKNMKTIFGYISKNDLINYLKEDRPAGYFKINSIIKPLDMIYEFENIEVAIKRFIDNQNTILGVYDEYFQYCGILDYYKLIDNMLFSFTCISSSKFPLVLNSNISCRSLFYNYNIKLNEEDMNMMLNDFLFSKLNKIPKEGDFIIYRDYKFTIVKVKNKKIIQIKIDKVD
ncbi:MAG: CNNM domain-containing protein [Exilispira sp.]